MPISKETELTNKLTTDIDDLRDTLRQIKADLLRNRPERATRLIDEALDRTDDWKVCDHCRSDVQTTWKDEEIPVWPEDHPKRRVVVVSLPVRTCTGCKMSWTDHEGEFLREKAIEESEPQ